MTWLKVGDTAATYPKLLETALFDGADDRTVNEVMGFVTRLAIFSSQHLTDSVVDMATCMLVGGSRTRELVKICVEAGLLEKKGESVRSPVRLIEDPDFVNVETRQSVEKRRSYNRQAAPAFKASIIFRDGDHCRWCGSDVHWTGTPGSRFGTLDHVDPTLPESLENTVVACKGCNSRRTSNRSDSWDRELSPPPARPRWGKWSRAFLAGHDYSLPPTGDPGADAASTGSEAVNVSEGIPGVADPGAGRGTSAGRTSAGDPDVEPASVSPNGLSGVRTSPELVRTKQGREFELHGRDGTGRDGKGKERTGRDGTGGRGTGGDRQGRAGTGRDGTGGKGTGSKANSRSSKSRNRRKRRKR